MTGFLTDAERDALRRDLRSLARLEPELLRIARREVSPPGGRSARNPNVAGSRPPVNLGALDALLELHEGMMRWAGRLADEAGLELGTSTDTPFIAIWFTRHLAQLAARPWVHEFADEVDGWARRLRWATDPPEARYVGPCQSESGPRCRGLFTGDGRESGCDRCGAAFVVAEIAAATEARMRDAYRERNGTPVELAKWLGEAGLKVTNKQVTYWGRSGVIVKRGQVVDGPRVSPLYNMGEVEDVARAREAAQ